MKKILSITVLALVVIAALTLPVLAQETQNRRQISVDGDAEVKVVPDQVVITLGVETVDKSLSDAKKQNDKLVDDFTSIAVQHGVMPADIQTDYLTIQPKYETRDHDQVFMGHNVRRRLVITLNDITKFDNLLTALVTAGASQVQSVQFMTTELRKYRDRARAMAITAAAEKARDLAGQLDAKIGKPFNIQERSSRWYSWYGGWSDYHPGPNPFNVSQNVGQAPQTEESPLAVGKISVTASVSVTFELQ